MIFNLFLLLHIIFVILWIGGVGFITIVLFPMITDISQPLEKILLFQRVEHKYVRLARIYALIVGITGFLALYLIDGFSLLFTYVGLGLTVMLLVWIIWILLLFGLESVVIRKILKKTQAGEMDASTVFSRINLLHWILLALSFFAIAGG